MKNLLQKVGSSMNVINRVSSYRSTDTSEQSQEKRNYFPRPSDTRSQENKKENIDFGPPVITIAARAVTDGIQEILFNSSTLNSEDLSGFYKLLDILAARNIMLQTQDFSVISTSNGKGCLELLLRYIDHPTFCESCSDVLLAPALIHALRLLRMMEVKSVGRVITKTSSTGSLIFDTSVPDEPLTYRASENVCRVLSALCSEVRVVNQLQDQLIKLFCLPISTLPITAIHLQQHVSTVISVICNTSKPDGCPALSDSIIIQLHESHLMLHIYRSLCELVTGPTSHTFSNTATPATATQPPPVQDTLAHGAVAEGHGMWIIACDCIVDILLASLTYNPVLLRDFESVGGYSTLTYVIMNTPQERNIKIMNIVTRLITGNNRNMDRMIPHPEINRLMDSLLTAILRSRVLRAEEGLDSSQLMNYCNEFIKKSHDWSRYEYILQNISYSLLTIYSSNPNNYNVFESSTQLLPTLALCIPSFQMQESTAAIFKIVNFLCLCSDEPPTMAISSLCASVAVMSRNLLENFYDSSDASLDMKTKESLSNLQQVVTSFEELIRIDSKYAIFILIRCGLFESVLLFYLLHLGERCCTHKITITNAEVSVYKLFLSLLSTSLCHSRELIQHIRASRLLSTLKSLITSDLIPYSFLPSCSNVFEQYIGADEADLEDNLRIVIDLLTILRYKPLRVRVLMRNVVSLQDPNTPLWALMSDPNITPVSNKARSQLPKIWQQVGGFECMLSVLAAMRGSFLPANPSRSYEWKPLEDSEKPTESQSELFECFQTILIAVAVGIHNQDDLDLHQSPLIPSSSLPSSSPSSFTMSTNAAQVNPNTESSVVAGKAISNGKYFVSSGLYEKLSMYIRGSCILASSYAEECVNLLFILICSPENPLVITNPSGGLVVISLLSDMNVTLAIHSIKTLQERAASTTFGKILLTEAGIITKLISKYSYLLWDKSEVLGQYLLGFLKSICTEHMILSDFMYLLKSSICPLVIVDSETQKLLAPWVSFDRKRVIQGKSWDSVKLLLDLAESSTLNTSGCPCISVGQSLVSESNSNTAPNPYLYAQWTDTAPGKAFPCSQFTVSMWIKITDLNHIRGQYDDSELSNAEQAVLATLKTENLKKYYMVQLLSINATNFGTLLDIQLDVSNSVIKITVRKSRSYQFIDVDFPYISDNEWHHITCSFHRSVRFGGLSKTQITIYLDGEKIGNEKVDTEIPQQSQIMDICLGKSPVDILESVDTNIKENNMVIIESYPKWCLGPFLLFDEILTQSQVTDIFMTGPSYCGTFQAESPLEIPLLTRSIEMLCLCNRRITDIPILLDSLGLSGLELIVSPEIESVRGALQAFEFQAIPIPLIAYNMDPAGYSVSTLTNIRKPDAGSKQPVFQATVYNLASLDRDKDITYVSATIENFPQTTAFARSIASCVSSLGGPGMLFPLLQAASTDTQIVLSLRLLHACIRNNSNNLNFMQERGYQMMSFILSNKPSQVITETVIQSIFDLSIDKGNRNHSTTGNSFHALLVDTRALFFLFLNHNIWDTKRFQYVQYVLNLIWSLVDEDCRHNKLNARRLSGLGLVRWVLLLLLNSAERLLSTPTTNPSILSEKSASTESIASGGGGSNHGTNVSSNTTWDFQLSSLEDAANGIDSPDSFLTSTFRLINVLMLSEVRQRDIDAISFIILYTVPSTSVSSNSSYPPSATTSPPSNADKQPSSFSSTSLQMFGLGSSSDDSALNIVSKFNSTRDFNNSFGILRLYLLRFLLDLYTKTYTHDGARPRTYSQQDRTAYHTSPTGSSSGEEWRPMQEIELRKMFSKAFISHWFLVVLEGCANDPATTSLSVRFLCAILQKDEQFFKEFCTQENFLALKNILGSSPQGIPVVLPLISLVLQIPISYLPSTYSGDITPIMIDLLHNSSVNAPNTALAKDEDVFSSYVRFQLLILDIFLTTSRCGDRHRFGSCCDFIIAMFYHSFECHDFFNRIMQHKQTLEQLVLVLIHLSNAFLEESLMNVEHRFSSISNSSLSDDESNETNNRMSSSSLSLPVRSRASSIMDMKSPLEELQITLSNPDGMNISDILSKVIYSAIFVHKNSQILSILLLTSPKQLLETYIPSFQKLIWRKASIYIMKAFEEIQVDIVPTACNIIASLIPLAQSRLLDETLLIEILLDCFTIIKIFNKEQFSTAMTPEKYTTTYKDVFNSTRYFALMSLQAVVTNKKSRSGLQAVLQHIRSNMNILCTNQAEDLSDVPMNSSSASLSVSLQSSSRNFRRSGLDLDEKSASSAFGLPILELHHFGWTAALAENASVGLFGKRNSAQSDPLITQCQTERNKIVQYFSLILLSSVHNLFLDDNQQIRTEAMRISASLMIYKRNLMDEILGRSGNTQSSKFSRKDAEGEKTSEARPVVLLDGFIRLLPSNSQQQYIRILEVIDCSYFEGEDLAFAQFSNWLTDYFQRCELLFSSIDDSVTQFLPQPITTISAIRQLQLQRSKQSAEVGGIDEITPTAEYRHREHGRIISKISIQCKMWKTFGLPDAASGALMWRDLWKSLQCGTIWGHIPVLSPFTDEERSLSKDVVVTKRLTACEGPERGRIQFEQDFHGHGEDNYDDLPHQSNAGSGFEPSLTLSNSSEVIKVEKSDDNFANEDIEEILKKFAHKGLLKIDSDTETEVDTSLPSDGDNDYGFEENEDDVELDLSRRGQTIQTPDKDSSKSLGSASIERPKSISNSSRTPSQAASAFVLDELSSDVRMDRLDFDSDFAAAPVDDLRSGTTSPIMRTETVIKPVEQTPVDQQLVRRGKLLLELARAMIAPEDWKSASMLSVQRIHGLETQPALLVLTTSGLHLLDGLQISWIPSDSGRERERVIEWVGPGRCGPEAWGLSCSTPGNPGNVPEASRLRSQSNVSAARGVAIALGKEDVATRAGNSAEKENNGDEDTLWLSNIIRAMLQEDMGHHCIPLDQIFTIYRRRYHLKNTALEVTDTGGFSILFACSQEQELEATIKVLLESELPNSIFSRVGMKNLQLVLGSSQYKKFMSHFMSTVTKTWMKGELTNFEYLMHLNACAGRSYQDLTQYPVFPWVLSDYESERLDLDDPKSYRDLSLPMGAIGSRRAQQYIERFRTMNELAKEGMTDLPPPFFYGTHYSCAGYVLYYLLRIQPYSRMSLILQGGHYDKADRLFKNIESSWKSASQENLQDVRELIPEFFCVPEFLKNSNNFEFGSTQAGEKVSDVVLPPWSKGDPVEFTRIHRQALESNYVSENIHNWIDLIFGCKQRGQAAADSMNVFVHLTYEGMVDVEAIADPMLRDATITQLNSFGQTPARLFLKPHPRRQIPDIFRRGPEGIPVAIDVHALSWLEPLSPPLSVVGASNLILLNRITYQQASYPASCRDLPVGDIRLLGKDKLMCVSVGGLIIPPKCSKFLCYGKPGGGISFHTTQANTPRALDADRPDSVHEGLHTAGPVTATSISRDGTVLATGGSDGSIRLWSLVRRLHLNLHHIHSHRLDFMADLSGHMTAIRCMDLCTELSVLASGSEDGTVILWDIRNNRLSSCLGKYEGAVVSLSVNSITGLIAALGAGSVYIYSVNGEFISSVSISALSIPRATVVLAPPVGDWQEGVAVVTGHSDGHILLWKLQRVSNSNSSTSASQLSSSRELLVVFTPPKVHRAEISAIRLCSIATANKTKSLVPRSYEGGNTLELLVGDVTGYVSRWAPVRLEQLPFQDVQQLFSLPTTVSSTSTVVPTGPLARAENFMTESLLRFTNN